MQLLPQFDCISPVSCANPSALPVNAITHVMEQVRLPACHAPAPPSLPIQALAAGGGTAVTAGQRSNEHAPGESLALASAPSDANASLCPATSAGTSGSGTPSMPQAARALRCQCHPCHSPSASGWRPEVAPPAQRLRCPCRPPPAPPPAPAPAAPSACWRPPTQPWQCCSRAAGVGRGTGIEGAAGTSPAIIVGQGHLPCHHVLDSSSTSGSRRQAWAPPAGRGLHLVATSPKEARQAGSPALKAHCLKCLVVDVQIDRMHPPPSTWPPIHSPATPPTHTHPHSQPPHLPSKRIALSASL